MKWDMNGTWNTLWIIILIELLICLSGTLSFAFKDINTIGVSLIADAILIVGTIIIGSILAWITDKDRKSGKNNPTLN